MKLLATPPLLDPARIAALRRTSLLDTPPEEQFDRVVHLTSQTLHTPAVLFSLVDAEREFFKSSTGLPEPWRSKREAPLSHSFCQHVVLSGKPLIIEDAREHPWVQDNPAITEMSIVAYAGMPLWSRDGYVLGAFCAAYPEPHPWGASEIRMLEEFTAVAVHEIALRGTLPQGEGSGEPGIEGTDDLLFGTTQFRALIERPLVGIYLAQDGHLLHVDAKFAEIFGNTQEEIVSTKRVLDLVGDEDRPWVEQSMQKRLRDPTDRLHYGFRGKRKDGSCVDIEVHGTRTEVGGRPAVIGTMLSISEREEADATLRRNEQELHLLIENAWDIIHVLNPNGTIRYISPSVQRTLGYTPQEMIGRNSAEFVHPDDLPIAARTLEEDLQYPGSRRFLEMRLRHKNGSWRTVEIVGRVTEGPSGEPIAVVNTHDITERKQAEEALRQETAAVELLKAVAVVANEATTIDDALRRCLARLCDYTGWYLGHVYLRDPGGDLVPTGIWHSVATEDHRIFREATEQMPFGSGVGLPGRVLASGRPEWIAKVTGDLNFSRAEAARESGLRAGCALPLLVGSEVVGVLEFFTDQPVEVDESLLEVMAHVGTQLGRVVEREHAKEALLRSEQRTRAIVEVAHDAFVGIGADGVITDWNAQAESAFGWTREEAVGRPLAETIIPPQYRAAHQKGLDRFLATGEHRVLNQRFEIEALHRDGHQFPVELTISPIKTDTGFVFASFLHDISERKQAEQTLRRSEERYDLVARATSDVVWDWNVATGELTWNKAVQTLFRFRPDEVGSTVDWWYNHIHPEDRERVVTRMHVVVAGVDEFWSDEYRFVCGDGSYAVVLDRGYVVRDDTSQPVRMIGTMMNITERKRAEESQRFLARVSATMDASLDYEATLVNIAHAAVPDLADYCLIDALVEDGGLRRVATAHVDPERESMLLRDQRVAPDADLDRHPVLRVVRTGCPVLVPVFDEAEQDRIGLSEAHRTGLRTLGLCSYIVLPMNTGGRTLGAMTLATAESGRRYTAADLVLAEELARRAAQAMDNARLYREARAAVRAREEVLAVVSHDLRNPLGTITLGASLLLKMGPERRRDDTRTPQLILRAASRMEVLIRDLLDASKMDSGHFVVEPKSQNADALVREAVEAARSAAAEKNIVLEADLPDNLPPVRADGDRVLQVFSNLIGNALKFTPEGGTVTVAAEPEGGTIRFWVSDTGPGIAPEQLPHLFDRFWQGRSADRRGAGLGLAIARGIVEAHGGTLEVESRVGEGSRFSFALATQ